MKHSYNVGGSEDYRSGFDSGYDAGFGDGIGKCSAGVWHSMDEAPPENETVLVKLQWDDKSTGIYVATKYNEDHDWCSPGWQIHPDDEDQLRDDNDEYPIIEWACIQKQDEV